MTWNTDNRANDYLFKIVDHANSEDVDVVCLQEAGGINWSNNAVQHLGFNLYAHGQVMILVRQSTAETIHMPQLVWRSERNNAMSITLLTATGPLAIINGYLPSGLDSITKDINQPKYWKALDTHMEINERISQHTHSIINMDANETNNKYDRIQIHKSDIGKPIPSGSDGLNSTMSLYTKNMKDAHRMTNDHLYTSHPPSQQIYTHQQPNVGMITKSKIDLSLVSNNIAHRLQSCNIHDTPKYWTKSKTLHPLQQHRNNYHSIIITKLKWDNIWAPTNCNTQNNPNPNLKGEKLKPGPNTNNLNATTKIDLAQAVNIALKQKWGMITRLDKGKGTHHYKMNTFNNILKKTILKHAINILGTAKPQKPYNKMKDLEINTRYTKLKKKIGTYLYYANSPNNPPLNQNNQPSPQDKHTQDEVKWLISQGAMTSSPTTTTEWKEWHAQGENEREKKRQARLDDRLATSNPKTLYKQICKPFSSTNITSLRKAEGNTILTTDEEIEQELTDYVSSIAAETKPHEDFLKLNRKTKTSIHFTDIMNTPNTHTIKECLTEYSNSSSGGIDNITPLLLKTICLMQWKITRKKSNQELKRELAEQKAAQDLHEMGIEKIDPPITKDTTDETVAPLYALHLLQKIIKHSLKCKDIPNSEKINIITGLPKNEGQVCSTDSLRPISVGPIIGRLINKIMAQRLGTLLKQHNLLDEAQFAFLPGGDIHEPLNSILQCYEQSLHAELNTDQKQCYIISYDISKAYDCIRWESIENALITIGASNDFIDFVMNSLKGTKSSIKTNIKGRVTPKVELHKSIKQGCPLAPLLFIILMDELHRNLRTTGGYELGRTTVSSRGYCDDTAILAGDVHTLKQMNKITYRFFRKHGLLVSEKKTMVTGRNRDGTDFKENIYWPGTGKPLTNKTCAESIKYLGLHINMNLTWDTQIKKLESSLHNITSRIQSNQVSILQGSMLIRDVLIPKFENSFKHITASDKQIEHWDKVIAKSISKRAGLGNRQIHKSSIFTTIRATTLNNSYLLAKTTSLFTQLTKHSELQKEYQNIFEKTTKNPSMNKKRNASPLSGIAEAIRMTTQNNIIIEHNTSYTRKERVTQITLASINKEATQKDPITKELNGKTQIITLKEEKIAIRDTYDLWEIKRNKNTPPPIYTKPIIMCTDGSTYKSWPSGAGIAIMETGSKHRELWGIPGMRWRIENSNNHEAELAAINKAIRSVEIWRPITIYTDSDTSIKVIRKQRLSKLPTNKTTMEARPYIISILRAIEKRESRGVPTTIIHVASHTGKRDLQSIGNSEADALAKWEARSQMENATGPDDAPQVTTDINKMQNELKYIIKIRTTRTDDKGETTITDTPIHGNIRKHIKVHTNNKTIKEWATRHKRGELIREAPKQICDLIKEAWKDMTSKKLTFFLDILNQADKHHFTDGSKNLNYCTRCTQGVVADTYHRIAGCPSIANLWNQAFEKIWKILGDPIGIHNDNSEKDKQTLENLNCTQTIKRNIHSIHINGENIPTTNNQLTKIIRHYNEMSRKKQVKQPKNTFETKHYHGTATEQTQPDTSPKTPLPQRNTTKNNIDPPHTRIGKEPRTGYKHKGLKRKREDLFVKQHRDSKNRKRSSQTLHTSKTIKKGTRITPYAGIIKTIKTSTDTKTGLNNFHVLSKLLSQSEYNIIEGLKQPKKDHGLGQHCAFSDNPNAKIETQTKQSGKVTVWLEAIEDIKADEEITIKESASHRRIRRHDASIPLSPMSVPVLTNNTNNEQDVSLPPNLLDAGTHTIHPMNTESDSYIEIDNNMQDDNITAGELFHLR